MKAAAGTGATIGAGETKIREWIRPGRFSPVITRASVVSQYGDGALTSSPQRVTTQMRGHDWLSSRTFWGAERRQGPGSSNRRPHSLDPDGWLVRFHTDTTINESPAAWRRPQGETSNLPPRPRPGGLGPRLAPPCLLDTRLLMGGTPHIDGGKRTPGSVPRACSA